MKKVLKIYSWIIFAVVAQCMVLLMIDFYLPRKGVGKAVIEEYDNILEGKDKINLKLPVSNAENIKISYNGEYISYIKDNHICIYSLADKKVVKTITDDSKMPIVTEWLPDRNIIMYSFRTPDNKPGEVVLWTYNADIDKERYYEDIITGLPQGSYVACLNFSPKTNVVYLNVKVGDNIAYLYKYNVMDELFWIANTTPEMVIKQTYQTDHFIYSPYHGGLAIIHGFTGKQYNYYFESGVHVIGSDFTDNIYFGLLNDENKIYELKFGKYDKGHSDGWNTISLDIPAEKEDIFFSLDKRPYYIDRQGNKAVSLLDGSEAPLNNGMEVAEILEKHLITTNDVNITIEKLKGDSDE